MWKNRLLFAGPCAAETREQLLETAKPLSTMGVDIFRAGIWKPRTHPGSFEGVGERGLPWLSEVQSLYGLKAATEVASAEHVEACLRAGLSCFWLGARTVANPFLVEEIAHTLEGKGVTIIIKNPVSPDIELWAGAVERLRSKGIDDIILAHRGVTPPSRILYRNNPAWGMAVSMHSRFPDLRMICDPSHISGDRKLVADVARMALDMGMDGLMVEVHRDPDSALSDSFQQLSPEDFRAMLENLEPRRNDSSDGDFSKKLSLLRARIDSIDLELCSLLSDRLSLTREIGSLKKGESVSILQPQRWNDILSGVDSFSREKGLDPSYLRHIFELIHEESVMDQNKNV